MTDRLVVLMGDAVAGVLTRLPTGRLRFDYELIYRSSSQATPLSLSMPIERASHSDAPVTRWLWGLLPENEDVLERWGRRFHVSPSSAFGLLGSPVGEDCAGAVRFCAEQDVERLRRRPGNVEWLDEQGMAARIRGLRDDRTAWLGGAFEGQFSLAGAQAKTALYFDGRRWGVPSGPTPTTHILKPAIGGFDDHDLNEHICLAAARLAGMPAVDTWVESFGDERVIVVRRYDRIEREGDVGRIHQEDLCQALGIHPRSKYQNEGGPSALAIVQLLRRAMPRDRAEIAVRDFVDALVWNWVIAGTDAHAKNYSLLLSGRDVRLAPLYDVASALPYAVHIRKLRMAMKVGSNYDLHSVGDRWTKAAVELDLDPDRVVARVRQLASAAPSAFIKAAAAVSIPESPSTSRLLERVAERAAWCVDRLP